MNKIYKVIYNKNKHRYEVVSELAKSHGGKCKTTVATAGDTNWLRRLWMRVRGGVNKSDEDGNPVTMSISRAAMVALMCISVWSAAAVSSSWVEGASTDEVPVSVKYDETTGTIKLVKTDPNTNVETIVATYAVGGNISPITSIGTKDSTDTKNPTGIIAMGDQSKAVQSNSIAIGADAHAGDLTPKKGTNYPVDNSNGYIAIGTKTVASGDRSIALGNQSTSNNGSYNIAQGNDSIGIGTSTSVFGYSGVSIGRRNIIGIPDPELVSKDGVLTTKSKTKYSEGDLGGNSVIVGAYNVAYGNRSNVIGTYSRAMGSNSVAIGSGVQSLSDGSIAIGKGSGYEFEEGSRKVGRKEKEFYGRDWELPPEYKVLKQVLSTDIAGDKQYEKTGSTWENGGTLPKYNNYGAGSSDPGGFIVEGKNALGIGTYTQVRGDSAIGLATGEMTADLSKKDKSQYARDMRKIMDMEETLYDAKEALKSGSTSDKATLEANVKTAEESLAAAKKEFRKNYLSKYSFVEGEGALGVGRQILAQGDRSMAVGDYAKAISNDAIAYGGQTLANGTNSMAMGGSAHVGTEKDAFANSMAIGSHTNVQAGNAVALGAFSQVTGENSLALGFGKQIDSAITYNSVSGKDSTLIGSYGTVKGNNSILIGSNGNIANDRVVGLGNNINIEAADQNDQENNTAGSVFLGDHAGYVKDSKRSRSLGQVDVVGSAGKMELTESLSSTKGALRDYTKDFIYIYMLERQDDGTQIGAPIAVRSDFAGGDSTVGVVSVGSTYQQQFNSLQDIKDYHSKVGSLITVPVDVTVQVTKNGVPLGEQQQTRYFAADSTREEIYADSTLKEADKEKVWDTIQKSISSSNSTYTVFETRRIQNVAPGLIGLNSTDAINGSQLFATNQMLGNLVGSLKKTLGDSVTVTEDGQITVAGDINTLGWIAKVGTVGGSNGTVAYDADKKTDETEEAYQARIAKLEKDGYIVDASKVMTFKAGKNIGLVQKPGEFSISTIDTPSFKSVELRGETKEVNGSQETPVTMMDSSGMQVYTETVTPGDAGSTTTKKVSTTVNNEGVTTDGTVKVTNGADGGKDLVSLGKGSATTGETDQDFGTIHVDGKQGADGTITIDRGTKSMNDKVNLGTDPSQPVSETNKSATMDRITYTTTGPNKTVINHEVATLDDGFFLTTSKDVTDNKAAAKVKLNNTIKFTDGANTKVSTVESKDGVHELHIDVTGLPVVYTDKDGNKLTKVGDKFYKDDQFDNGTLKPNATSSDAKNISIVNPDGSISKTDGSTPTTVNNVGSSIGGDVNNGAPTGSTINGEPGNNRFIDNLNKVGGTGNDAISKNAVVTTGDLKNLADTPLFFAGDSADGVNEKETTADKNAFGRKLSQQMKILGGVDLGLQDSATADQRKKAIADKLTDGNIGVISDGTDTLTVKLAKNLKDLDSTTYTSDATATDDGDAKSSMKVDGNGVRFVNANGDTVSNTPTFTTDGITGGNKTITDVASGIGGEVKDAAHDNANTFLENVNKIGKEEGGQPAADAISENVVVNAKDLKNLVDTGFKLNTSGQPTKPGASTVKIGETINVVNGANTKVSAIDDNITGTHTFHIDVTGMPISYTDGEGNVLTKIGDDYYKNTDIEDGKPKDNAVAVPADKVTNNVKVVNKDGGTTEQGSIGNVKSVFDSTIGNGGDTGSQIDGINDANKVEKVPGTNQFIKDLTTLKGDTPADKEKLNSVSTVGDLQKVALTPLFFEGDTAESATTKNAFGRKLSEKAKILGGQKDVTKLTDNNIGVVSNGSDTLTIKLAKELKDLDSVKVSNGKDGDDAKDLVTIGKEVNSDAAPGTDGENGTIGLNGKNGSEAVITIDRGTKSMNDKVNLGTEPSQVISDTNTAANMDRITYTTKGPNNSTINHEVATLDDGFFLTTSKDVANKKAAAGVKLNDTIQFNDGTNTKVSTVTSENGVHELHIDVSGLPMSYTDNDGDAVTKIGDKYYKSNQVVDGKPIDGATEVPADQVTNNIKLVNTDGTTNTPGTISNVASGIGGEVKDAAHDNANTFLENVNKIGKEEGGQPAADAISENVVVNAKDLKNLVDTGFKLNTSGQPTDPGATTVKIGETINVVNGVNTKVSAITTSKDGVHEFHIDVTGMPISYTDTDGNALTKIGDNYYKNTEITNGVPNKDAVAVDPKKVTDNIKVINKDGSTTNPGTISNVKSAIEGNVGNGAPNSSTINGEGGTNTFIDNVNRIGADTNGIDKNSAVTTGDLKNLADTPLFFSGDAADGKEYNGTTNTKNTFGRKLSEEAKIVGGVTTPANLTDNNIGVVSNGSDTLTIKLAKQLTGLDSATYTSPTTKTDDGDATSTMKVDGNGIRFVGDNNAVKTDAPSLTTDGITGGNKQITNVGSGLKDGDTTISISDLKDPDKVPPTSPVLNNAANVGDLKNIIDTGFKLNTSGQPTKPGASTVKIGDTINIIDGANTKVSAIDDSTTGTHTFHIDVNGLPMSYVDSDGNPLTKIGDKFYKTSDLVNGVPPAGTDEVPANKVTSNVSMLDNTGSHTGVAPQIKNVGSGLVDNNGKTITPNELLNMTDANDPVLKNAVNVGDLKQVAAAAKTEVTGTGAAEVTKLTADDGHEIYNVHVDKLMKVTAVETNTDVARGGDGKYYKAGDIADKTFVSDGNGGGQWYNSTDVDEKTGKPLDDKNPLPSDQAPQPMKQSDLKNSIVNPNGEGPTVLDNVKSGIGGEVKNAAGNNTFIENINKVGKKNDDGTVAPDAISENTVVNAKDLKNLVETGFKLNTSGQPTTTGADTVKIGDTIQVVDGKNTTVSAITSTADGTHTFHIDVTGLPVTYTATETDGEGKPMGMPVDVTKTKDGYQKADGTPLIKINENGKDVYYTTDQLDNNVPKPGAKGLTITDNIRLINPKDGTGATKITNVAAGTDDTDAVNVSQLKEMAAGASTEVTGTGKAIVTSKKGDAGQTVYNVHVDPVVEVQSKDGSEVTRGGDGKYYKASDIADKVYVPNADGNGGNWYNKTDVTDGKPNTGANPQTPAALKQSDIKTSLVNPNAGVDPTSTDNSIILDNVKSGIGGDAGNGIPKGSTIDGTTGDNSFIKNLDTVGKAGGIDKNTVVNAGDLKNLADTPLFFTGDSADGVAAADGSDKNTFGRKLSEEMKIVGGVKLGVDANAAPQARKKAIADKLTDGNIGVISDGTNKLTVKLAKELTDLTSVTTGSGDNTTTMTAGGTTTTSKVDDIVKTISTTPNGMATTEQKVDASGTPTGESKTTTVTPDGVTVTTGTTEGQTTKTVLDKDGLATDGKVVVTNGKDGDAGKELVTIDKVVDANAPASTDGEHGQIGLDGKNGSEATITIDRGTKSLADGKNIALDPTKPVGENNPMSMDRITYATKGADGSSINHEVATMDDGFLLTTSGDVSAAQSPAKVAMNHTITIVDGANTKVSKVTTDSTGAIHELHIDVNGLPTTYVDGDGKPITKVGDSYVDADGETLVKVGDAYYRKSQLNNPDDPAAGVKPGEQDKGVTFDVKLVSPDGITNAPKLNNVGSSLVKGDGTRITMGDLNDSATYPATNPIWNSAVNVGDLKAASDAAKTEVTGTGAADVTKLTAADGHDVYNVHVDKLMTVTATDPSKTIKRGGDGKYYNEGDIDGKTFVPNGQGGGNWYNSTDVDQNTGKPLAGKNPLPSDQAPQALNQNELKNSIVNPNGDDPTVLDNVKSGIGGAVKDADKQDANTFLENVNKIGKKDGDQPTTDAISENVVVNAKDLKNLVDTGFKLNTSGQGDAGASTVKIGDTINVVDGANTKVSAITSTKDGTHTFHIDVTGLPMTYTAAEFDGDGKVVDGSTVNVSKVGDTYQTEDGTKLVNVGGKYYKPKQLDSNGQPKDGEQGLTVTNSISLQNPNSAADPATLKNVGSGLKDAAGNVTSIDQAVGINAVNVDDLRTIGKAATTEVTGTGAAEVTKVTGADGQNIYNVHVDKLMEAKSTEPGKTIVRGSDNKYYYVDDALKQANDGKWYPADQVGTDGKPADGAVGKDTTELTVVPADKLKNSLVNPNGNDPTVLDNVKSGIGGKVDDADSNHENTFMKNVNTIGDTNGISENTVVNAGDLKNLVDTGFKLNTSGHSGDAQTVKIGETIKVVDGANTKVSDITPKDGVHEFHIDVTGLPMTYTATKTDAKGNVVGDPVSVSKVGDTYQDAAGNKLIKVGDKYYRPDQLVDSNVPNPEVKDAEKANGLTITDSISLVNNNGKTIPTTLKNVGSGLKDANGNPTSIDQAVGSNAVNVDDLRTIGKAATTEVTGTGAAEVTKVTGADGQNIYNVHVDKLMTVKPVDANTDIARGGDGKYYDAKDIAGKTFVSDGHGGGNWYDANDVDQTTGKPKTEDDGITPKQPLADQPQAVDQNMLKNSVVNPNGDGPTVLDNVKSGIGGKVVDPEHEDKNTFIENINKVGKKSDDGTEAPDAISENTVVNAKDLKNVVDTGFKLNTSGHSGDAQTVKIGETIKVVDGANTKVSDITSKDGVHEFHIDVTGLPMTYTVSQTGDAGTSESVSKVGDTYQLADGTKLVKVGDKFYKPSQLVDPKADQPQVRPEEVDKNWTVNDSISLVNKDGSNNAPTLKNVGSGLKNAAGESTSIDQAVGSNAVNVDDLRTIGKAATTEVTGTGAAEVTKVTGADGQNIYNVHVDKLMTVKPVDANTDIARGGDGKYYDAKDIAGKTFVSDGHGGGNWYDANDVDQTTGKPKTEDDGITPKQPLEDQPEAVKQNKLKNSLVNPNGNDPTVLDNVKSGIGGEVVDPEHEDKNTFIENINKVGKKSDDGTKAPDAISENTVVNAKDLKNVVDTGFKLNTSGHSGDAQTVKIGETIKVVDGANTKVSDITPKDGVHEFHIDVTGLPVTYTAIKTDANGTPTGKPVDVSKVGDGYQLADGTKLVKAGDKYYTPDQLENGKPKSDAEGLTIKESVSLTQDNSAPATLERVGSGRRNGMKADADPMAWGKILNPSDADKAKVDNMLTNAANIGDVRDAIKSITDGTSDNASGGFGLTGNNGDVKQDLGKTITVKGGIANKVDEAGQDLHVPEKSTTDQNTYVNVKDVPNADGQGGTHKEMVVEIAKDLTDLDSVTVGNVDKNGNGGTVINKDGMTVKDATGNNSTSIGTGTIGTSKTDQDGNTSSTNIDGGTITSEKKDKDGNKQSTTIDGSHMTLENKDKDGKLTGPKTEVSNEGMTITPVDKDGNAVTDPKKQVSITDKGLNNGGNQIINVDSGLKGTNGSVKLKDATGDMLNNAVNVGDLKEAINNAQTAVDGDGAAEISKSVDDNGRPTYKVHVDKLVEAKSDDGKPIVRGSDNKFYYKDESLQQGTDGKWYALDQLNPDNTPVEGAVGKDTTELTVVPQDKLKTSLVNPNGDGATKLDNIKSAIGGDVGNGAGSEDKVNGADGTNSFIDNLDKVGKEGGIGNDAAVTTGDLKNLADTPLFFGGDSADGESTDGKEHTNTFDRKLGKQINIKGEVDLGLGDNATAEERKAAIKEKLSDGNIGVISNGKDTLTVKLSKDLKDLNTIEVNDSVSVGKDGDSTVIKGAETTSSFTEVATGPDGQPLYEVDEKGEVVRDANGDPIPVTKTSSTTTKGGTVTIKDSNVATGPDGKPLYKVDENGNPVLDEKGHKIPITESSSTTTKGGITESVVEKAEVDGDKPLIDENGNPITSKSTTTTGGGKLATDVEKVKMVDGKPVTSHETTTIDGSHFESKDKDGNYTTINGGEIKSYDKGTNGSVTIKGDSLTASSKDENGHDKVTNISSDGFNSTATTFERDGNGQIVRNPDTGLPKEVTNSTNINSDGFTATRTDSEGNEVLKTTMQNGNIAIEKPQPIIDPTTGEAYKVLDKDGNWVPAHGYTKISDNGFEIQGINQSGTGISKVRLSSEGLDNGGNRITHVAEGIAPDDAVNVSQLRGLTQNINNDIANVGANAAALAGLKAIQYDPLEPTQIMAAVGTYRGKQAAALGIAHYKNEDTMFHMGVSIGSDHTMANVGVTYKFGRTDEKKAVPDRYKAGPISSTYVLQDEMVALKEENARMRANDEKMNAAYDEILNLVKQLKQDNEEMKKKLEKLEKK